MIRLKTLYGWILLTVIGSGVFLYTIVLDFGSIDIIQTDKVPTLIIPGSCQVNLYLGDYSFWRQLVITSLPELYPVPEAFLGSLTSFNPYAPSNAARFFRVWAYIGPRQGSWNILDPSISSLLHAALAWRLLNAITPTQM